MQNSKFALFLGDLSMHCNEADLEEAFSPYGAILEIRVKRSKETAKTLSYGFLEFASASSAVNAMNDMDGYVLKGRPLRIRWAASKKNPVRKRDIREDLSDRISMHVKFMSYKIDKVITEELLRNLFSIYGEVCDTTIKQVSIDRKSHRLKGYGFVSYFNDEAGYMAAQRALTELHDTCLDDVTFKCELSNIIDAPPPSPFSPHMGGGSPHHQLHGMGLPSGESHGFEFDMSQHQSSYYDDYDGHTSAESTLYQPGSVYGEQSFGLEPSPAPPVRTLSNSLSSNSGFGPSPAPPMRGIAASLSTGSETFSLALDKEPGASPTAASLELRTPSSLSTEDIHNPYALSLQSPSMLGGSVPARGAPSGSYQITAPGVASMGSNAPRQQGNSPRPYLYGQQQQGMQSQGQGMHQPYGAQFPTQFPAQYASQSRYHPNRESPHAQQQQQLQHGGYDASAQYNPRRAVGNMNNSNHANSPLSAQAPYWQPQQHQQGGLYGAGAHQHHNPRPPPNGFQQQQQQRYDPRQQQFPNQHMYNNNNLQQAPPLHPLQGNYAPNPRLHQPIYARAPPPNQPLSLGLPGDYSHSYQQPPLGAPLAPQSKYSPSGPSSFDRSPHMATSAPRPFFGDMGLDASLGQGLNQGLSQGLGQGLGQGLSLSTAEPLSLEHGLEQVLDQQGLSQGISKSLSQSLGQSLESSLLSDTSADDKAPAAGWYNTATAAELAPL